MATNRTTQQLKTKIMELVKKTERDQEYIKCIQDESTNLELALKKCILSKAELNDKIEQLTDELEMYKNMYNRTKIVAQALSEAVFYLAKDKQNG